MNEEFNNSFDNQYNTYDNYKTVENMEAQKTVKHKKSHGFLKAICYGITFGLVAGIIIFGINYFGGKAFPTTSSSSKSFVAGNPSTIKTALSVNKDLSSAVAVTDVSSIAEACMPSVVAINGTVTTTTAGFYRQTYEAPVAGSGIIIGKNDTELLIVTNAHVVDGVNDLKITFIDDVQVDATVKGSKSSKDLAVVAVKLSDISQSTMDNIVIAEIGDASDVKVGEAAIAIGNSMGYGQSVTVGVISALNREITIDNVTYTVIQTDAAINPGNSGGALINAYGQVVGINSAKLSDESVEGMGYSIPISDVMDVIEELMNKETRQLVEESQRGFIGISGQDIDASTASVWGYPEGIYVGKVQAKSAAEEAGIKYRDIIVSFDGDDVTTMAALKKKLAYYRVGEQVEIGFYRYENDEYVLKTVTLTLKSSFE